MTRQQLSTKPSAAVQALGQLLGAHATLTRELNAQLEGEFGLTLNDYEVLLLLSKAEERSMRRIDLAREVRLTPSGVTRMLDRLEASGLVEKGSAPEDARVTYAVLTDAGLERLRRCWPAHSAAVDRLLGERLDPDEVAQLTALLARLDETGADCEPGA